jgi:Ca2+-binding EF-hand superfamily protein
LPTIKNVKANIIFQFNQKEILTMKKGTLSAFALVITLISMSLFTLPAGAENKNSKLEKLEQRFNTADENGDGEITEAEAETGMPKLAENFSRIDADESGTVNLDEIKTAIAKRGNR